MKIVEKLVRSLLILVIIAIPFFPYWIKFIPMRYISFFTGKSTIIDNQICNYSIKVAGKSMIPVIEPGGSLKLNRCFEEKDLMEGDVILFDDNSSLRLGIIRYILPLDPIIYKVSNEKTPELFHDVVREEITAITKDVDTSTSKYQDKQAIETFILNYDEFLTDFYLAKIPRGAGIETSTVEKTDVFSRQADKFCLVIIPKKDLVGVGIEILNIETGEKISLGKNIIFSASSEPNINCSDFSLNNENVSENLNLSPGFYQYEFSLNHQILKTAQFEIQ